MFGTFVLNGRSEHTFGTFVLIEDGPAGRTYVRNKHSHAHVNTVSEAQTTNCERFGQVWLAIAARIRDNGSMEHARAMQGMAGRTYREAGREAHSKGDCTQWPTQRTRSQPISR